MLGLKLAHSNAQEASESPQTDLTRPSVAG
jgi:hypothetical protein